MAHAADFEFWITRNIAQKTFELQVHLTLAGGASAIGLPLSMKSMGPEDEGIAHPPTMALTHDAAQSLIDALWGVGIRPSKDVGIAPESPVGSVGELAAVREHLSDMRQIVAGFMEMKTK